MSCVVSATQVSEIKLRDRNSDVLKLQTVGMALVHEHYLVYSSCIEIDDDYDESIAINYDYKGPVKVIDIRSNVLTSEIYLNAKVNDVINIEGKQIAVAACSREGIFKIELLSVSEFGSLEKNRQFELPNTISFFGFTYSMGHLFIAAFRKVLITNLQGTEIKTFALKDQGINESGTSLYLCSKFDELDDDDEAYSPFAKQIAVSPDNATMYIADFGNCTVRSYSMDGELKSIAKNQISDRWDVYPGISGIEVDNTGTVFVNHILRGKIYVLSLDNNTFETLIDGKKGHFAISRTGNKLVVAMDDIVHIYEVRKRVLSAFHKLTANCLLL